MTNAFNLSQLANNTNSSGQVSLSTGVTGSLPVTNLSGTVAVVNGGTGVSTSTGTGSTVLSASPTFTGTPLSTTAANGTNTTQIATTAFAYGLLSTLSTGYTKLANGLIIQWGTYSTGGASGNTGVTFPIAFPNACRIAMGGPVTSRTDQLASAANSITTSGAAFTNNSANIPGQYIAIGY